MKQIYRLGLKSIYHLNNEHLYRLLRILFSPQLSKILIHITNACNFDCRYCYVDRARPALAKDEWFNLLAQAKKLGVSKVGILGGEPLCVTYLEDILAKIKQLKMKSFLYTNGSLLTEEWIDTLKQYKTVIVFKYDSDNEAYQYHTQQELNTLDMVEEKIKLCVNKGLRVVTFTTVLKRNAKAIGKIFDRSLALGAFPAFERYLPVKNEETNADLEVSDDAYQEAMSHVASRLQSVMKEWIAAIRIAGRSCGCYSDIMSITPSGEVLPCPYLPEHATLGNVRKKTLKELATLLKAQNRDTHMPSDECKACAHKYACAGGCYTYPYLKSGRYMKHCKKETSIGFCSYMLVDLYDKSDAIKV